jgi:aspartate 1-decarboxylase
MFRQFLLGKLHRCTVTRADLDYVGSVSIDRELMDAAGILPYEKIQIVNIENGARFESYAIEAPFGSRVIGMNGGCAHLAKPGDICLIMAYQYIREGNIAHPRTVIIGDGNEIEAIMDEDIQVPVTSAEPAGSF